MERSAIPRSPWPISPKRRSNAAWPCLPLRKFSYSRSLQFSRRGSLCSAIASPRTTRALPASAPETYFFAATVAMPGTVFFRRRERRVASTNQFFSPKFFSSHGDCFFFFFAPLPEILRVYLFLLYIRIRDFLNVSLFYSIFTKSFEKFRIFRG